jgi:hypothetical protein
VVRESGGLVASADRRFSVPDLDGPALVSSDLVIGSERDALPVRVRTSSSDVLTGMFELYGRTADQLRDVDTRVDLAPLGGDAPLRTVHASLLEINETDRGATRTALLEMPLSDVPPGRYVVRADVLFARTTVSKLTREIEIVAGDSSTALRTQAPDRDRAFAPAHLLNGDAVRRYLGGFRQAPPYLAGAADLAAAGAWDKVDAVLGDQPAGAGLRGLAGFARRDYDAAARFLTAAVERDGNNVALAFFLGWAHTARGNRREAVSAWRRAVFIDPTFVSAHLALADVYVDLGERPLAIQAVRAGLSTLPQSPELIDKLARLEGR